MGTHGGPPILPDSGAFRLPTPGDSGYHKQIPETETMEISVLPVPEAGTQESGRSASWDLSPCLLLPQNSEAGVSPELAGIHSSPF